MDWEISMAELDRIARREAPLRELAGQVGAVGVL